MDADVDVVEVTALEARLVTADDSSFSHTFSSPGTGGPQRTNYNQKNWDFVILY